MVLTLTFGVVLGSGLGTSGLLYADDTAGVAAPLLVRVRSENADIAAIIRGASEQSATFRRLIETIDRTDGLVYVQDGKCKHSVRACLMLSVKVAGPFRLLRVVVDARKTDCQLMGLIGHELQHAVEVLEDPHVTDATTAYTFFERTGPTGSERFETQAALNTGYRVSDEACRAKGR